MKILQVCAYAAPYGGNFLKSLLALTNFAAEDDVETVFCFPETAKGTEWCKALEEDFKVYYLPLAHARILPKTYMCLKKIFKEHQDIIYAHSHFELYDIPLAVVAPKNVKLFWHLHDALETSLHGLRKYIWKAQYSIFSKRVILLSVSQKHMRAAINLGFNKDNAYYEPNAIDTDRILNVPIDNNTTCDFIIFGWDYFRKGVDLAEKAIARIGKGTILGVVGLSQNKERKEDGFTIKEMKSSNDINAIFCSTKCFLHISRAEGLSYALLEALYSGLPVIVSDIEENMVAQDFPTAFMVQSENVDDIASMMQKIIFGGINISVDDIKKSREMINNTYSIDSWVKRIYKDYQTLVLK